MPELRSPAQDGPRSSSRFERLRNGVHNRFRHHSGRDPNFLGLNAAVLAGCLTAYVAGHLAWRSGALHPHLRHHAFDVLATPVLLAVANLLTSLSSFRSNTFSRPLPAFMLTAMAIAVWECLAPLYRSSTADWIDVGAYALGSGLYLLLCRWYSKRGAAVRVE